MEGLEEIKKLLEEHNQSHILKYWNDLNETQQKEFLVHLHSIDFKEALFLWQKAHEDLLKSHTIGPNDFGPIHLQIQKDLPPNVLEEYRKIGYEEISNNSVGVVVLAGGQGTRLGMPYPKGMCPIGIPSGKTLFQLQAERIQRLIVLAEMHTGRKGVIQWYLMTSEATDMLIVKFLEQNNYFGLEKENVTLFKQANIPCFDLEGKILLEEKDAVATAPNGNGGLYQALKDQGILEDMDRKGVKYVHVHSVDNILTKVADPVFLGKCIRDHIDFGMKVVRKRDPTEPLGIVVKINNENRVIEYNEIPKKSLRSDMVCNTGNICNHFLNASFLRKICTDHLGDLKIHMAKKTVSQVGPEGDIVRPSSANCIKLEKFIFDVITFSQNLLIWQVERSEEFSPIKNSDVSQKDCFATAKRDLIALHTSWIEAMGGKCPAEGMEVSPLRSYDGEGLVDVGGREFTQFELLSSEEEEKENKKEKIILLS
ncbi:hypothetical protein ABEB36_007045 [Hypothenemus hampei]|uniref:UDP-N-acetylglucosamine diphosphorylase n=1 Tax=Hypothenemus hampei TaxID=57062 RepID=A0ABD1ESN3_HYPHA